MTIVCRKCMHKSREGTDVCPACGSILVKAADRHVVGADENVEVDQAELSSSRSASDKPDSVRRFVSSAEGIAKQRARDEARVESDEAMREVLDNLSTSTKDNRGSSNPYSNGTRPGTRPSKEDTKPFWKRDPKLTAIAGGTLLVVVVVGLIFGLGGSSGSSNNNGYNKNGTTKAVSIPGSVTQSIFQFSGEGSGVTSAFTSTSTFLLSYKVDCPAPLAAPATFKLVKGTTSVGEVTSGVASTKESGSQSSFGGAGTFNVSVDTPSTCTWLIRGDT
jgi:hypothetical protein